MLVECIYPSGERIRIETKKDNFLLPIPSLLQITEINGPLYIDGQVSNFSSMPYSGEGKLIELGDEKYNLVTLKDNTPDKIKIEYYEFATALENIFSDGLIYEELLFTALNEANGKSGVNLCTFNRQIESITHHSKLEEVFKQIGVLPNIFSKPRSQLKSISEVKPVDNVTQIGHEAIKYLASHSEHWEARKANGLMPARLLAKTLEDDCYIYENIAAKCLIDKISVYALGLRDNLKNITMQMPSEESFMSVSAEQRTYFHARETLLKGYSGNHIHFINSLLEEQLRQVSYIVNKLSECKDTRLYRELKRCKPIVGPLKPTNIFMMDNNYKHVYKMWKLFYSVEENKTDTGKVEITGDITNEYPKYCETLLFFALKHFNFTNIQGCKSPLFENGLFIGGQYEFKDWTLSVKRMNIPNLKTDGIAVSISTKMSYKINIKGIVLPEFEDFSDIDFLSLSGENLVLKKKPNDNELNKFCNLVRKKANGDRRKEKSLFNELKKKIEDSFVDFKKKESIILFIPITFKFIDSSIGIQRCIEGMDQQISEFIKNNNITAYFYLSPFRPTDYSEKETYPQLSNLLDYGYADIGKNRNKNHPIKGVLPITVSDINSYRRFTKAILNQMLEVDDDQKYCPICGSALNVKENSHYCRSCEMQIFITKCNKCKEEFKFTKYKIPKTNGVTGDTNNLKILIKESGEGFKNITDFDQNGNPICPYCGCSQ